MSLSEYCRGISRESVITFCIKLTASAAMTYLACRLMSRYLDPTYEATMAAKKMVDELKKKLKLDPRLSMNNHEMIICTLLVPQSGEVEWSDIGGCEALIAEICDRVILPLSLKSSNRLPVSNLFTPAKGILLHGPPGCGKTLIAKAVAGSCNAHFINFDFSVVANKWYGESQKLIAALFSLAKKIQPCIIFIDEIDSFFRTRDSSDHETSSQMKTQFMSLWDGFFSNNDAVIVMGATNRPHDLDPAIHRRLPMRFYVQMPSEKARAKILEVILKEEATSDNIDFTRIARATPNMSGSDLKEICRMAALTRLRSATSSSANMQWMSELVISEADLMEAAAKYTKTLSLHAHEDVSLD